jgi:ubiquitin-protein ligase E3 C
MDPSISKMDLELLDSIQLILQHIPFIIPFSERVVLFRQYIQQDRKNLGIMGPFQRYNVKIHRNYVFEDGHAQLNQLGSNLKGKIAISFIDSHGLPEEGIDGGGVFKEFLTSCLKQAFDIRLGLFQATTDQKLYPSSLPMAQLPEQLDLLEFLGRIIGKALYEGVLIDVQFATFFLTKWLGKRSYFQDVHYLDQQLYQGLQFLKSYKGDVQDLSLTFSLDAAELGSNRTIDLIPNGSKICVTAENRYYHFN